MLDRSTAFVHKTPMTSTPVPQDFRFTWSYSSISTFEICPRKWWAEKVSKVAGWESNPAAEWGVAVHEELEYRAQDVAPDIKPLPMNMSQYQGTLDKVRALAAMSLESRFEYKMGLTADNTACGFDDADMFGRGIVDTYFKVREDTVFIGDYKTGGRYYGPTLQPIVCAKMTFAAHPEINHIKTAWTYLKVGKNEVQDFTREGINDDFAAVTDVVQQMQRAIDNQNFPARKGFLCRSYCSDFTCPHNGRKAPQ